MLTPKDVFSITAAGYFSYFTPERILQNKQTLLYLTRNIKSIHLINFIMLTYLSKLTDTLYFFTVLSVSSRTFKVAVVDTDVDRE